VPPLHQAADEVKLCGFNACMAAFRWRAESIVRVYVTEARVKEAGPLLHWCAQHKLAYKVVGDEELSRVAESTHHEGVCLLVKEKRPRTFGELMERLRKDRSPRCLLGLENVGNPHNLGAILRVCAHFGVSDVVCLGDTPHKLSAALARTAEGGAESVELIHLMEPAMALSALKKEGVAVLATSHLGKMPLYKTALPARCLLLLGSENQGLSKPLMDSADGVISIGGSGSVESLNVACAATAVLGEFWRQHKAATA
jgi:TrmH RNA methyltransferase